MDESNYYPNAYRVMPNGLERTERETEDGRVIKYIHPTTKDILFEIRGKPKEAGRN